MARDATAGGAILMTILTELSIGEAALSESATEMTPWRPALPRLGAVGEARIKRLFDIVFALVALVVFLPVMVFAALAIKLDSPGPVLFRQTRHGLGREPFRMLKFRSMIATEDAVPFRQAMREDARVTRIGRWLRRFNIDELPQLLNVISGDMSLVGPRPHAIAHDEMFERQMPHYTRRYRVKPGVTGWAQVNGLRGPTDTREKIERRVQYDLDYIARRSPWLDLKILILTLVSPAAYRNAL
jgi:exopolysaccharide biosynthesis polyprenyl glycosylphosphotransferase